LKKEIVRKTPPERVREIGKNYLDLVEFVKSSFSEDNGKKKKG